MTPLDCALFDNRPRRARVCPHCSGCGTVEDAYALLPCEHFEGAPNDALCATVVGAFDIFTACREAVQLAKRSQRHVAFDFNGQVVLVGSNDDPDRIARAWWLRVYNETPEESAAKR